jgi:hypothetical protein
MENYIWVVFCVLGVPLGLGVLIGWLVWGRKGKRQHPATTRDPLHAEWLANELDAEHLKAILTDKQRTQIREHYNLQDRDTFTPSRAPATAPLVSQRQWSETPGSPEASTAREVPRPVEAVGESFDAVVPEAASETEGPFAPGAPAGASGPVVSNDSPAASEPVRSPFAPEPGPVPLTAARDALDPAVLMLYLGAFLVVAAGIVYASYNWADLGSWQKLGLLGAATVAFGITGWVLLGNERVRQAAETFVAISALLVPANAIAGWTVFGDNEASTAVIVLLGSAITGIVYVVFSNRPGGWMYDYGAAIFGLLAVGSVLPATGMHWGWGGVTVLLAVAAIRELGERLPDSWDHLRMPLRVTGVAAIPIGMAVGLGSVLDDVTIWIAPITFAAAAVALAAYARRSSHAAWGILTSFAALSAAVGTVAAINPDAEWAWAPPALVTSVLLIVAGEYGPDWLRRPAVRLALHIEAVLALLVSILFALADHPWIATTIVAAAVIVSALIALVRTSRWWLVFTGGFAAGLWFTILAHVEAGGWNTAEMLLFVAPLPVLLAVPAFRLDRVSERNTTPRWGEPLWLVAGLLAVGFTALPIAWVEDGDPLPVRTLAATCVVLGLAALVAAWSTDRALIRIGYGLWTTLAAGLAVYSLDLAVTDNPVAMIAILAGLVAISAVVFRPAATGLVAWLSPRRADEPRSEMVVHLVAIGLLLLTMVVAAFRYISTVADDALWNDLPGVRWTWIAYLATFTVTTIATAVVGWKIGGGGSRTVRTDPGFRLLPGLTIAQGLLSASLLLRMTTTDTMVWTWVGLGLGVVLLALPLLIPMAGTANAYRDGLVRDAFWAGIGLLAMSTAANMSLTGDRDSTGEYGTSAAIYLGVGLAVLAIGLKTARTFLSYAAFVAFTLAAGQFARAVSDSDWAVILAFVILSWVVIGTALVLPTDGMWSGQSRVWVNSALGIGAFAVLVPGTNFMDVEDTDTARQIFVVTLVSMAGLLAVDARLRTDRRRAIIGSALAMLALLIQISTREPENFLWYSIPLGLYLLGLGVVVRRDPRLRDILLGAGSGVLLVPALLLAQSEGEFGYLLLAGGISIGLFLIGITLRLRVLIAAGVIGVTIIVLRMLIDAVLALESWITLLTVGLVLLGGGTASLVWKEALRERLDRLQSAWHDMG